MTDGDQRNPHTGSIDTESQSITLTFRGAQFSCSEAHRFGGVRTSETGWPVLAAVEYGQQFEALVPNAIRNDVRGSGHYEFARSDDSAWPADFRLRLQEIDVEDTGCIDVGIFSEAPRDDGSHDATKQLLSRRFFLVGLAPGMQPVRDLFMVDTVASVQFRGRRLNLSQLPFLRLDVCSDRFASEEGF
jgi:hypothetical protein